MPKPPIPGRISSLSTLPIPPASVTPASCWACRTILKSVRTPRRRRGNTAWACSRRIAGRSPRKLTLDYGLRYDFQTYLKEQHGRMPVASFSTPNPTVGGLLGATIYGATCNCDISHNYPWAFGPRIGAAYQIDAKTVLRAGAGITYGVVQTPSGLQYSLADYYTFNSLGYGITPAAGAFENNPFPNVTWPNYNPGKQPILTAGLLPPSSPNTIFNSSARPPRTLQWSVGCTARNAKRLVVEATYVGNRGVWWSAEGLDPYQCNCLTDQTPGALRAQPQQSGESRFAHRFRSALRRRSRPDSPRPIRECRRTKRSTSKSVRYRSGRVAVRPHSWGLPWAKRGMTRCRPRPPSASRMACRHRPRSFGPSQDLVRARRPRSSFPTTRSSSDIFNLGLAKQLNQLVPPLATDHFRLLHDAQNRPAVA